MKLLIAFMAFLAGVSIACSATRSATSPAQVPEASPPAQLPSSPIAVVPQEKTACTLKMAQAPDIKGLKLGLTPDEVLAFFPGSKEDPEVQSELARRPNSFGGSNLFIRPSKYGSKDKFKEVSQITIRFLDGKLSNLMVGFNGPEWSHVDDFVAKFVANTALPAADQWQVHSGLDNQLKILKCTEFEVRIFAGGEGGAQNYMQLQDSLAEKTLKDRRDKARAKASPTPGQ